MDSTKRLCLKSELLKIHVAGSVEKALAIGKSVIHTANGITEEHLRT